ncbi:MAG TPA: cytochrome c [Pyrinomonadaceae bacterium]|jgi:mono/diheme cytochrome c family protein
MKFLKSGAVSAALAFFIFACSENKTADSNAANVVVTNAGTAAANNQPSAAPDELAAAKKIYLNTCIKCHKEDGTGGETDLNGKRIKAPNFTSERLKKESDAEFIEVIKNGEPDEGMPAFKDRLGEEDIKNLVKLIRTEFQKP